MDDVEGDDDTDVAAVSEAEGRHVAVVARRAAGLHEARLTLVEDVGANIAIDPVEPAVAQLAITQPVVAEPVIAESVSGAAVVAESMTPERVAEPPREPARVPFRSRHVTTTDLPLFVKGIAAHEPIGDADDTPAAPLPPPRPPLSVRRATEPVGARPRVTERKLGPLDRDLLEDLKRVEREEAARGREEARLASVLAAAADDRVEPFRRAGAAALDVAVLGGLAAFVFWATLRLCGISLSQLELAALVPLVGFIVAMDVAYLLLFTAAGGQTVGKMLMGIRVIGDEPESGEPLSLRQAAWRAGLTVVGLGVGWLPALFGRGLTLHDRFSHTRVVRV